MANPHPLCHRLGCPPDKDSLLPPVPLPLGLVLHRLCLVDFRDRPPGWDSVALLGVGIAVDILVDEEAEDGK